MFSTLHKSMLKGYFRKFSFECLPVDVQYYINGGGAPSSTFVSTALREKLSEIKCHPKFQWQLPAFDVKTFFHQKWNKEGWDWTKDKSLPKSENNETKNKSLKWIGRDRGKYNAKRHEGRGGRRKRPRPSTVSAIKILQWVMQLFKA